jgi:hypothetical protein
MKYYNSYATKEDTIVSNTSNYSKYINSTGTHYISNSGHDENNKYSGGAAGDQTGEEWYLRSWYNRPWNCVLRYEKDANVGQKLAELGCAAALNNNIGYDQNERYTYWTQLQKVNYDPSKITTKCEADCSAGVIANTKAVGYLLGISALKNISATYTGDMRKAYKAAGFTVLTDSKYLTGTAYLLPGDILLNDEHHTATNVTKGSKATTTTTTTTTATTTVENNSYVGKGIGTAIAQTEMNIRAQANTSSLVVGTISKGTKVEVLSVSNGWYKIVWSGVSCGYAYTSNTTGTYYSYTAKATTTTTTSATTKKTATSGADSKNSSYSGSYQTTADLNIRNGAGTNNSIMVTIPKGTTVQNYGYYSNSNGTPWLYVQFTYNKVVYTGFASKKYLKKV